VVLLVIAMFPSKPVAPTGLGLAFSQLVGI